MALFDVKRVSPTTFGTVGTHRYQVASGNAASINAGEPVGYALGQEYAATLATNKPVVGTDYMAGISQSTSTDTVAAAGVVDVFEMEPGVVWRCAAKVASGVATQALYNALVGYRVLFDKTGGVYTVLVADNSTYGLVIQDLDVTKYPGQIAFSIRAAVSYLA